MTAQGAQRVWTRRQLYALAVLALAAAALRVPIGFSRGWIGYDEANYLMIARNASAGYGYVQSTLAAYASKFHPLSFLVPEVLGRVLGDLLLASNIIFVVMGAVTTALVGVLGAALFGVSVGLAAAALAAVAPVLSSLLSESISHSLFLPPFLAGVWLAWRAAQERRLILAAASGIAIGISWWARADGVLVALAVAAFLLLGGSLLSGFGVACAVVLAFSVGFGTVYEAYSVFVHSISGGASNAHGPLYDFLAVPLNCRPTRDLHQYASFVQLMIGEPRCVLERVRANANIAPYTLLSWTGFPMAFLVLIGAAWVAEPRYDRRTLAANLLLLIVTTAPLAMYLPFHYRETRYVAPYAALAFIWCAAGAFAIGERLVPVLGRAGRLLPAGLMVLMLGVVTVLHVRRLEEIGGEELIAAGRWIDEHAAPHAVVWTSQSQVAYYARRPWSYPPDPDNAKEWQRLGSDEILLVLDDREFRAKSPPWAPLVPPASSEGLELLYTSPGSSPYASVYRVRRGPIVAAKQEG